MIEKQRNSMNSHGRKVKHKIYQLKKYSQFIYRNYSNIKQATLNLLHSTYMQKYFQTIQFLLILASFAALSYSCETQYALKHSVYNCAFYMDYADSSCANSSFINCSYWKCANWSEVDPASDQSPSCIGYQKYYILNWNDCTKYCCNAFYSNQNTDAVNQCRNSLTQSYNKSQAIIIMACTITSAVILLSIIVGYFLNKWYKRNFRHEVANINRQRPQLNLSNHSLVEINMWKEIQSSKPLPNVTICSVCLEEGCFFELECHHLFHCVCILACFSRKVECILCRSTTLEKARIYCQRCFKFYFQISINQFRAHPKNITQIKICSTCHDNI